MTFALYVHLGHGILTKGVPQNLATWILWVLLDAVAAGSMFVGAGHGNYQLPTAYVVGGSVISWCIRKSGTVKWTWFETLVSTMVVVAIVAWKLLGPDFATILSTTGMAIATIPQVKDSWQEPEKSPIFTYLGFTLVNGLSVIGGKSWTIEERFYPTVCAELCVLVVLVSLRRTKTEPQPLLSSVFTSHP